MIVSFLNSLLILIFLLFITGLQFTLHCYVFVLIKYHCYYLILSFQSWKIPQQNSRFSRINKNPIKIRQVYYSCSQDVIGLPLVYCNLGIAIIGTTGWMGIKYILPCFMNHNESGDEEKNLPHFQNSVGSSQEIYKVCSHQGKTKHSNINTCRCQRNLQKHKNRNLNCDH